MRTTCHNLECPGHDACTHNIHRDGMRDRNECPEGQYYMSAKQSIWADYVKKCEENNTERMPYNLFFEY